MSVRSTTETPEGCDINTNNNALLPDLFISKKQTRLINLIKCISCHEIPIKIYSCDYGHMLCLSCKNEWENKKFINCNHNNTLQKLVDDLILICPNEYNSKEGTINNDTTCEWKGKLSLLSHHLKICPLNSKINMNNNIDNNDNNDNSDNTKEHTKQITCNNMDEKYEFDFTEIETNTEWDKKSLKMFSKLEILNKKVLTYKKDNDAFYRNAFTTQSYHSGIKRVDIKIIKMIYGSVILGVIPCQNITKKYGLNIYMGSYSLRNSFGYNAYNGHLICNDTKNRNNYIQKLDTYKQNDIISIIMNFNNYTVKFAKNNIIQGTQHSLIPNISYKVGCSIYMSGDSIKLL